MINYAVLTPHPPLIVPAIGKDRLKDVNSTVKGMQKLAGQVVASGPETLVFLTPHGNVFSDCISALAISQLKGDFTAFGNSLGFDCQNDLKLLAEIKSEADRRGINFALLDQDRLNQYRLNAQLDHGILVPLYYLKQAGLPQIPILAISIGYLSNLELYTFGSLIKSAAEKIGRKTAIIASGDMSHRLSNDGPYDYHPDGASFDGKVKELIQKNDVQGIFNLPEKLRENAGECGYRSIIIMLGALDSSSFTTEVFSYEGPMGVGYLTAGFNPVESGSSFLDQLQTEKETNIRQRREQESLPVRWARMNLEAYIKQHAIPQLSEDMKELADKQAGVFVSLKKNGQLRGCIGTIMPAYKDLSEEIAANARAAGTDDPRFAPVETYELEDVVYSVDILGQAESCGQEDLDPSKYGVIVSQGGKRGLLLPALEGVDTVEEQLAIAKQKAGIAPGGKCSIMRFEVKRFC
ncbi:MAG: AmmeMemoRadiSam system protein A [Syntrophomonadaceae bacterium]|nr:AmmeMemoRadiSam system protein A [Syntrophomonadaceae bacterium]MDD3023521.1 AmmeMemoRadiSam system protein A [Syntrophomonadaceae bacterium]